MIKRDCIYYNYGRTAPKAYGAYCDDQKTFLNEEMCGKCLAYKLYEPNKVCECCGQTVPRGKQY